MWRKSGRRRKPVPNRAKLRDNRSRGVQGAFMSPSCEYVFVVLCSAVFGSAAAERKGPASAGNRAAVVLTRTIQLWYMCEFTKKGLLLQGGGDEEEQAA